MHADMEVWRHRPGKIVAVALNYRDHAREQNLDLPKAPLLFAKWPSAVIHDGEPIVIPPFAHAVDYEAELGVVIGKRVRGISASNALDAVAGYVCANDISARDLQFADGQYSRGKSLDTFCPLGPGLASAEEVGDPNDLRIRCLVNGEVMQDSSTSEMIFSVGEVIAYVTAGITLEPGDLVLTGTPAGTGYARSPQILLRHGDLVTVDIEKVGSIANPVVVSGAV